MFDSAYTLTLSLNPSPPAYFEPLNTQGEITVSFYLDKTSRTLYSSPFSLFSAISQIGGFASIVALASMFIGASHQKML